MEAGFILKVVLIVLLSSVLLVLCFKLAVRRLFSDHKFFAIFCRSFYNYYYSLEKIDHLRTNNFGYAPVDKDVAFYETDLQYGLQLYKELTKSKNGCVINELSSVVEVGCGKGAGAEFLVRNHNPKLFTGVDFSQKAIDFCSLTYKHIKEAQFICADALQLPFTDHSVDVVINVESSHLYKDAGRFFTEVHRILKPGGRFLFTDYRPVKTYPIERLEKEITDAGFSINEKRTITPNILDACKQASARREKLVEKVIPWYLRKYFRHYAVVSGSKKFLMMSNGEIVYVMYQLKKSK